jgi:hypothetical protein
VLTIPKIFAIYVVNIVNNYNEEILTDFVKQSYGEYFFQIYNRLNHHCCAVDYWKAAWQDVDIFNKNLIEDPTKQIPGFDLPRKIWCKLNRFRTGHGKCNNMLFHWNIRENPSCECSAEKETIQHIVEECPLTKFQQGFSKLHLLTEDALNWLQQIKNI